MMFSLKNKKAVITGGGSGIGKAIALLLAQQGADIHIIELNKKAADESVTEIRSRQGKAVSYTGDVVLQDEVMDIFNLIGPFDILVNNAGVAHVGKAHTTRETDFDRLMNINVKGVYNCLFSGLPLLKENGGGVIINMASIAAHVGLSDRFAYAATKGAVKAMTLSVARDYIVDHIRCNSISPARVHTPFVDGFIKGNYPEREREMFEQLSRSQPIGRMGTPEEIAALVLYLASDEAAFITGCDYLIDGGFVSLNN